MASAEDAGGVIRQYEPTYRLKPHDELKFSPSAVRKAAEEVVKSVLEDKVWNGEDEAVWTVTITEQVKQRVRDLKFPRYKIVVQVVLGQVRQQGVKVASRCLWDADADNHASYTFENDTIWCTAMVFGIYTE